MIFPGPQQSTFWFDFEGLSADNLWIDRGPYQLSATPQAGFTAPSYGLAKNAHNKGYANFTGAANVYATLPLRFYDVAPTQYVTLVFAAQHGVQALNARILNIRDATRGLMYYFFATNQANIYLLDSGGVASQYTDPVGLQYEGRTRISIWSLNRPALNGYDWQDRGQYPLAAVGNTNPIAYNAALVPCIGSVGALSYFVGRMYWLIMFPFILTHSEAQALTDWMMVQV